MNKIWAKVLAVIACAFIFILYIIFCTEMGFKHGGGILVFIILCAVLRAVWKGINRMAEETNKEIANDIPKDNTTPEVKEIFVSKSSIPMESEKNVSEEDLSNLPPIPIDTPCSIVNNESVKCEVIQSVSDRVISELQPNSQSSVMIEEQVVPHIIDVQDKTIRNRNVLLIVLGSVALCLAFVFMIVSLVEFQVIWDYASDRFRFSNWFERTSRAHFMEMILFVLFSVVATIILSVQYAIFHQTKSNYSRIIWGCIELVAGLCTLPALLSSISAIVFGTLYVVNGLKKMNYL